MTKQNLIQLVSEMASRTKPKMASVFFIQDVKGFDSSLINKALDNASSADEKFDLTKSLLESWCGGNSDEAHQLFGELYQKKVNAPLIATLTGRHNQMRFWIEEAGSVGDEHCDSCGGLYLLQVGKGSNPEIPEEYIQLASGIIAKPFWLPNGGAVFAKGTEPNVPKYWSCEWKPGRTDIDYSKK